MSIHGSRQHRGQANAALFLALMASSQAFAQAQPPATSGPPTVRAFGEATVSVKPDVADVDLGVVTQAATGDEASTANARKMEKIVEALKKEVGSGGEVKTVGYSVGPRHGGLGRAGPEKLPVTGYVASNVVRVRVPNVNAVGRVIDAALKVGANDVQRVSFSLKDPEASRATALASAAKKARARADALAAALGMRVKGLVSLAEGELAPFEIQAAAYGATMERRAAQTPIEVGPLEVRATATAIFSVEPAR